MLADRYDLALSTASEAARDAYVQGCDLALTFYPGAIEAFDRATAADPSFSLPHAAKAQVLMREGNVAAARAALVAAKDLATGVLEREASHIAYFELAFAGQTDAAIDALYAHLAAWPRDALKVINALAMAASYDPDLTQFLGIRLPVTFDTCEVIEERWANWARQDLSLRSTPRRTISAG